MKRWKRWATLVVVPVLFTYFDSWGRAVLAWMTRADVTPEPDALVPVVTGATVLVSAAPPGLEL